MAEDYRAIAGGILTEFARKSDQELLATLTTPRSAALTLARFRHLTHIAQASVEDLCTVHRKDHALRIKAAFELGLRMHRELIPPGIPLDTPEKVANLLGPECRHLTVEHFWVISLNARVELLAVDPIAKGALNTVNVGTPEIFRCALTRKADSIVLAHNHPSGRVDPSEADISFTRQIVRAGQSLRIPVRDHVIIGIGTAEQPKAYASLRELGLMAV